MQQNLLESILAYCKRSIVNNRSELLEVSHSFFYATIAKVLDSIVSSDRRYSNIVENLANQS